MAAGLGARFGIDPTIVRIGFVIGSLAGGSGLVAYAVLWVLLPVEGGGPAIIHAVSGDTRTISEAAGVGVFVLIALFLLQRLGLGLLSGAEWPLSITAAAAVIIWRVAGEDDRAVFRRVAAHWPGPDGKPEPNSRRRLVLRVIVGGALILIGATSLLSFNPFDRRLALWAGRHRGHASPAWLWSSVRGGCGLARDLTEERRQRIRSEERAEMATRVHDSVLQTLGPDSAPVGGSAGRGEPGPPPGTGAARLAVRHSARRPMAAFGPRWTGRPATWRRPTA